MKIREFSSQALSWKPLNPPRLSIFTLKNATQYQWVPSPPPCEWKKQLALYYSQTGIVSNSNSVHIVKEEKHPSSEERSNSLFKRGLTTKASYEQQLIGKGYTWKTVSQEIWKLLKEEGEFEKLLQNGGFTKASFVRLTNTFENIPRGSLESSSLTYLVFLKQTQEQISEALLTMVVRCLQEVKSFPFLPSVEELEEIEKELLSLDWMESQALVAYAEFIGDCWKRCKKLPNPKEREELLKDLESLAVKKEPHKYMSAFLGRVANDWINEQKLPKKIKRQEMVFFIIKESEQFESVKNKNIRFYNILIELSTNNRSLSKLNLASRNIEDEEAKLLANALQNNTTLTQLNLSENKIGTDGGRAIAEALGNNTTLTHLHLRTNRIGDTGGVVLTRALSSNTTLTQLDLRFNQIGDAGGIALTGALASNTTLTQLNLSANQIGDVGGIALAGALGNNTTLTHLHLRWNQIGNAGCAALAGALASNTTLTHLDLGSNQIGDDGGVAIAGALASNTTLTHLDLGSNQIGDDGGRAIAGTLASNTTLTQLNLSNNQIEDAGGRALAGALASNTALTQLDLSFNQIGNANSRALARALASNTVLTQLYLGNNRIGDAGGRALAEALSSNTTLIRLDLRFNQIGNAGGRALTGALASNTTLTQLNLSANQIGDVGGVALAGALGNNTTLIHLHLRWNQIGNAGCAALAGALGSNTTLTQLDLGRNQIGNAGCAALARALDSNTTLTHLDLGSNRIGDTGGVALAGALASNTALIQLDLSNNQIENQQATTLTQALANNNTLLKLSISTTSDSKIIEEKTKTNLRQLLGQIKQAIIKPNYRFWFESAKVLSQLSDVGQSLLEEMGLDKDLINPKIVLEKIQDGLREGALIEALSKDIFNDQNILIKPGLPNELVLAALEEVLGSELYKACLPVILQNRCFFAMRVAKKELK